MNNVIGPLQLQNRRRIRAWRHRYADHCDGALTVPDPRTPEQRDQGAELLFRLGVKRREMQREFGEEHD